MSSQQEQQLPLQQQESGVGGIVGMDAVALMQAIHRGDLSCLEVMDASLDRIALVNPVHNALVALEDGDSLRAQARALDTQAARGEPRGLLYGFPQAPKDLMPVRGMRSTRGCLVFRDEIPQTDAVAFARMRQAGALFVGRSNTPEFGLGGHTYNPVYGLTRNALDPSLSAGGSSGGAAAAVALHMLPLADGSDMMGSLRTPAAFNGVFGLRTTPGLIPHGVPDAEVLPPLSVNGPMARNLPDMALLLSVLADFPDSLPFRRSPFAKDFIQPLERSFRGVRIGWLGDLGGYLPFQDGLLAHCESALPQFMQLGCQVEPIVPNFDFHALWQAWIDLRSHLFYRANQQALRDPADYARIKPEAQWEFERGRVMTQEQVDTARQVRLQWQACVADLFSRFDFLLMPTAQVYPFLAERHWPAQVGGRDMDTYHRWMQGVIAAPMAAIPALSVPVGVPHDGHAAGIQILARPYGELPAMQLAHAYDQVRTKASSV